MAKAQKGRLSKPARRRMIPAAKDYALLDKMLAKAHEGDLQAIEGVKCWHWKFRDVRVQLGRSVNHHKESVIQELSAGNEQVAVSLREQWWEELEIYAGKNPPDDIRVQAELALLARLTADWLASLINRTPRSETMEIRELLHRYKIEERIARTHWQDLQRMKELPNEAHYPELSVFQAQG